MTATLSGFLTICVTRPTQPRSPPGRSRSAACSTSRGEAMLAEFREELAQERLRRPAPHPRLRLPLRPRGRHAPDRAGCHRRRSPKQSAGELVDDLVGLGYVERIADPARQTGEADLPDRARPRGPAGRLRPLQRDRAALGRALRPRALRATARAARGDRRRPRPRPPCPSSPTPDSPRGRRSLESVAKQGVGS